MVNTEAPLLLQALALQADGATMARTPAPAQPQLNLALQVVDGEMMARTLSPAQHQSSPALQATTHPGPWEDMVSHHQADSAPTRSHSHLAGTAGDQAQARTAPAHHLTQLATAAQAQRTRLRPPTQQATHRLPQQVTGAQARRVQPRHLIQQAILRPLLQATKAQARPAQLPRLTQLATKALASLLRSHQARQLTPRWLTSTIRAQALSQPTNNRRSESGLEFAVHPHDLMTQRTSVQPGQFLAPHL